MLEKNSFPLFPFESAGDSTPIVVILTQHVDCASVLRRESFYRHNDVGQRGQEKLDLRCFLDDNHQDEEDGMTSRGNDRRFHLSWSPLFRCRSSHHSCSVLAQRRSCAVSTSNVVLPGSIPKNAMNGSDGFKAWRSSTLQLYAAKITLRSSNNIAKRTLSESYPPAYLVGHQWETLKTRNAADKVRVCLKKDEASVHAQTFEKQLCGPGYNENHCQTARVFLVQE